MARGEKISAVITWAQVVDAATRVARLLTRNIGMNYLAALDIGVAVGTISPEIMLVDSEHIGQRELPFRSHGGRRPGAGRKRGHRVSHAERPKFRRPTPVHVTLRVRDHVWNLRSGRCFRRIRRSLAAARGRFGMRVIEFSVLGNHLHLIVEADDDAALSRGLQGLAIRIAKALNALMASAGKIFADHYHSRLLLTPTELLHAIGYVLANAAHHYGIRGPDLYSSESLSRGDRHELLLPPRSWLLRVGRPSWSRSGRSVLSGLHGDLRDRSPRRQVFAGDHEARSQ